MGMLSHGGIEIILDHEHDRCGMTRTMRIVCDRTRLHLITRTEPVHVNASVFLQLIEKLGCQYAVMLRIKISQRIVQRQLLRSRCKGVLPPCYKIRLPYKRTRGWEI